MESLRIIRKDIESNTNNTELIKVFYHEKTQHYPVVTETDGVRVFSRNYIISENRFFEFMSAMLLRKRCCSKKDARHSCRQK